MTKRMLIDAAHAEETRVVVVDGTRVEDFDFESSARKQLRGNIYLAKVTRVEPSLQAAFIEYGGNRHGFLAFNEIHPDYYQIPHADREALMREAEEDAEDHAAVLREDDEGPEDEDDEMMADEASRRNRRLMRRYKIQEVIKRRQIMLVQVVKEERGNKGAALTTYLSLAGRYGVLMPNTARGGGISRKITVATDRKRLKTVVQSLDVPQGMGLIVRTAGAKRTKAELKRDYEYLMRMWENIREKTMHSVAPALIYEEEDLVKRAIRDMFDKDLEGIWVEGDHEEGGEDEDDVMDEELARRRRRLMRRYKIQEVIKRRQIMLVQVVKEERGNKGAALTTYLSLAGRYCVLMPNTARGGGVSRKIVSATDRKRLKTMIQSLDTPEGMGLIVRTAGAKRTKAEIKRDYEYLMRLWENIREMTLHSIAPALIYEEEDLVKRAIRDMYDKDLDGIVVEGEEGYREAKEFMRMLMPSQAKKITAYREPTPLFIKSKVEDYLAQIYSPVVPLKSGGYLVINQTEALVAIDVNSGRSTRERNIEATAL